ncbi:MAG: SAM-dependent methyltransferase, partial [Cyclobacteriaceae bacterium]
MEEFLTAVQLHLSQETFIKLTLSKPVAKVEGPVNVYARVVNIKGEPKLSITYRYPTQDTVKNFSFSDSLNVM